MLRFLLGLVVGFGTATLVSKGKGSRPMAKQVLKSGLKAVRGGMEAAARLGETVEDLLAEAREEIKAETAEPEEVHHEAEAAPKQPRRSRRQKERAYAAKSNG